MITKAMDTMAQLLKKEEERNKIKKQIAAITKKINAATAVKMSLIHMDNKITNDKNKWERKLSGFQSSAMSPVVVADKFEGASAEVIAERLPVSIEDMNTYKSQSERVQAEIAEQLSKLGKYIGDLEDEKAVKLAELAAIV